jgi:hypothetical protein
MRNLMVLIPYHIYIYMCVCVIFSTILAKFKRFDLEQS